MPASRKDKFSPVGQIDALKFGENMPEQKTPEVTAPKPCTVNNDWRSLKKYEKVRVVFDGIVVGTYLKTQPYDKLAVLSAHSGVKLFFPDQDGITVQKIEPPTDK